MSAIVKINPSIEPVVFNVREFCVRNRLSLSTWHKLQREGRTPRLMLYGAQARISLEAEREWRARMEQEATEAAAVLERKRRVELSKRAGRAAAQSPRHVSKRKKKARTW